MNCLGNMSARMHEMSCLAKPRAASTITIMLVVGLLLKVLHGRKQRDHKLVERCLRCRRHPILVEPATPFAETAVSALSNGFIVVSIVMAVRKIHVPLNDPSRVVKQRGYVASESARVLARLSRHYAASVDPPRIISLSSWAQFGLIPSSGQKGVVGKLGGAWYQFRRVSGIINPL